MPLTEVLAKAAPPAQGPTWGLMRLASWVERSAHPWRHRLAPLRWSAQVRVCRSTTSPHTAAHPVKAPASPRASPSETTGKARPCPWGARCPREEVRLPHLRSLNCQKLMTKNVGCRRGLTEKRAAPRELACLGDLPGRRQIRGAGRLGI